MLKKIRKVCRKWVQGYKIIMIFFTQADAHLRYTPQHKPLFLQLPNMKTIKMTVSFSSVVFKTVTEICRTLSVFLFSIFNCSVPYCMSLLRLLWFTVPSERNILDWSKVETHSSSIFFLIAPPLQTSEDQRSCPCWSLQMIPLRRKRRKTRTLHRMTSGT